MANIVEKIPDICNCIAGCINLLQVGAKCATLRDQEQQLDNRVQDMRHQLDEEEAKDLCKKPKRSVKIFFERVESFKTRVTQIHERFGQLHKWKRIFMVLQVCNHVRIGRRLLERADQLQKLSLVQTEVFTRGPKLLIDVLIGDTAIGLRQEALNSIRLQCGVIGIHGSIGACKTTLMKFLYNDVYDDKESYKAVYWAGAPKEQNDSKSIQQCLADALRFEFNDEDVVRRSSLLSTRLRSMAPGHIVLFLDDLKESFRPHEVGIPIGPDSTGKFCCTLVFSARSEDVCNRMDATKYKMNLVPEVEAGELFLREAGPQSNDTDIQEVVDYVVQQCARMPLVITTIARSMRQKNIHEWKNRLNEMMGTIEKINDEETVILEQLKFSFNCIQNTIIQNCFLASAKVLQEGCCLPSVNLIQNWISEGLIAKKHCTGLESNSSATNYLVDQGHTIINKLQRAYLLEVVLDNGTELVTMNAWIRKMAESIREDRGKNVELSMERKCRGRKRVL